MLLSFLLLSSICLYAVEYCAFHWFMFTLFHCGLAVKRA